MANNRYTSLQGSAYNPMSLQEIMMAPTIQRKQHDNSNTQIQEYLAELAKVNPHSKHWEEAQAEKNRLMSELDKNATVLAQKGFSPDITSNLMKFNRDYQTSTSPMGKIGQFNAVNEAAVKDSELYRSNNINQGYSPDIVERRLNEESQDWEKNKPIYDERGKVIAFQPRPMSKYVNHLDEADKYFKSTGISSNDWGKITSGLQESEDGTYQYVGTTSAERSWANNNPQLKSALDFLNSQIVNPNADLAKSLKDQYKTPEEAITDINAMMGIYKKDSVTEKYGYQMSNLSKNKDTQEEPVKGIYTTNAGTYNFTDSFDKLQTTATNTLADPNASPKSRAEARDSLNLTHEISEDLTNPDSPYYDPEYTQLQKETEEIFSNLNPQSSNILKEMLNDGIFQPKEINRTKDKKGNSWSEVEYRNLRGEIIKGSIPKEELFDLGNHYKAINKKYKTLSEKQNTILNKKGIEEIRYVLPYEKTSENTLNALNLLKASTVNNLKPLHASITNKNVNETLPLNENDKLQIAGLIKKANEGQIQNIIPTQVGRNVGFTIELKPSADSELYRKGFLTSNIEVGSELISVFIPISTSTNPLTGTDEASMINIASLPNTYGDAFRKVINTGEFSSTYNPADLGQNAVSARAVFGNNPNSPVQINPNDKIDFLKNRGKNPSDNYVTMTGQSGNDPNYKPLTWSNFIRYDILDQIPTGADVKDLSVEAQRYLRSLQTSGAWDILMKSAEKYKVGDATYRETYQLGTDQSNTADFLRALQNNELRLESPHDSFELARLKALE